MQPIVGSMSEAFSGPLGALVMSMIKCVLGVRSVLFFCRFRFCRLKELSLAPRFSIPYLNALSARLRTKSDRK